jgi:hypothetical protein
MVENSAESQAMIEIGHKYLFEGSPVIAINKIFGGMWYVRHISGEFFGPASLAHPDKLTPMPMKYFHGKTSA